MTEIILRLRALPSGLAKLHALKTYADEYDKQVFQWAYDPFKRYYLNFDDIDYRNLGEPSQDMFSLLSKLSSRSISGNNARALVEAFATNNGDLIKLICNKDLNCGVSATTLNTVFGPAFIPKFKIQLATEENIDKVKLPVMGQLKYNGARVVTMIENGVITFKSRGGHEFSFPKLEAAIRSIYSVVKSDIIIDGELTFGDSQNSDHTKVSGLVNSAIKGTPIKEAGLCYNIFDTMTLKEFNEHKCKDPYFIRYRRCCTLADMEPSNMVVAAKTTMMRTHDEIRTEYEKVLASGYEGLVLKNENSLYTFKRSKDWIKLKASNEADLLCVGCNPGKEGTKYEGMIGSLICEGKVENQHVLVDVGSGLSDEDRSMDPNYYVGKTIEVLYNKVIQDSKTGLWSLFLPRFVIVRRDK